MTKKNRIARLIAALAGLIAGAQVASAADKGGALACCMDLEERVATLEATTARKETKNVSVTISGEVSRGLYWYDGHYGGAIDNPNAPTRFSIGGTVKVAPDVMAGYVLELGLGVDDPYVRQSFLWIGTGYGTVTIGKTGGATYQIADQQVANVNVLARPSIAFGRIIDGELNDVLRYDTPTVAGFTGSVSTTGQGNWDVALRHRNHYADFKVAAGLGYAEDQAGRRISGSASAMHVPTGFFGSFAAGRLTDEFAGKSNAWDVKAGIEKSWTSLGPTTLFFEYGRLELVGTTGNGWGAGAVQSVGPLDLFAGFRDVEGTVEVLTGARLKF